MSDLGDRFLGTTFYSKFTTVTPTGKPMTISDSPTVQYYVSSGTAPFVAGVSLDVDFNGVTGLNMLSVIATSTSSGMVTGGVDVQVILATGSVSGVLLKGYVIAEFSLQNRAGLRPATVGRNLVVDAAGLADANVVKLGPTGSGTAQTARDIGASVLLSAGTGSGQLDFTSGVVKANVTQLLGTAWLTPGTAGTPDVNVKLWNALSTVALPLVPTVAGRTLDVSAGGEAGVDWANVGSPTTALALTGTTIATTQKVDIETIKTNPVVNAGTVTFPTGATLASTTNITAGTITTAVNLTTNNDKTGYSLSGTQTFNLTGNITGNLSGSVGSVTGNVGGNVSGTVASVTAITASGGIVSADVKKVNAVTVNGNGTLGNEWGP